MASSRVKWTDSGYIIRFRTRRRQPIRTAPRRSRPLASRSGKAGRGSRLACGWNTLFLEGAELQYETPEQRHEIRRALIDMMELSSEQLREKRYADYRMEPDAWTAPELLERYFVPQAGAVVDRESFYRDVKAPTAQAAIKTQLAAIERAIGNEPSVQPS